jgi:hypothetical protein
VTDQRTHVANLKAVIASQRETIAALKAAAKQPKWATLLVERRVSVGGSSIIADVRGDSGLYRVEIGPGVYHKCSCPAVGECSHTKAVRAIFGGAS